MNYMCNTPKNTTYVLHVYHVCNTYAAHLVVYTCTSNLEICYDDPLNSMIIFDDVLSLIKLNVQNIVVNYCTKRYNK